MASWIDTKKEIEKRKGDLDGIRQERILAVEEITNRPLIVYGTDFTNRDKVQASKGEVTLDANDKIAFDEVTQTLEGPNLDVMLHSPGGSAEAAESIVELLRARFSHIRFFVPDQAKSAATMLCCAGDELLLDEKSELGPIDPQMVITRPDGHQIIAPAHAITKQFEEAKNSLAKNPAYLPAWMPILQSMAPSLLQQCEQADALASSLVQSWLKRFMLKDAPNADAAAKAIALFLSSSGTHLSHGRRIGIEQLATLEGFHLTDLRQDPRLRDAIWNLYLGLSVTFESSSAFKIAENGKGQRFVRHIVVQQVAVPRLQLPPVQAPPQQPAKGKDRHGR